MKRKHSIKFVLKIINELNLTLSDVREQIYKYTGAEHRAIKYLQNFNAEQIRYILNYNKDSNGYFSQIEEAFKHNEPMKVDLENTISLNCCYTKTSYKCPKCSVTIIEKWHIYCPVCGQKLDWRK